MLDCWSTSTHFEFSTAFCIYVSSTDRDETCKRLCRLRFFSVAAFVRSPSGETKSRRLLSGWSRRRSNFLRWKKVLLLEDTDSVALLTAFPSISTDSWKESSVNRVQWRRAKRCDKFWKPVARQTLTSNRTVRFRVPCGLQRDYVNCKLDDEVKLDLSRANDTRYLSRISFRASNNQLIN